MYGLTTGSFKSINKMGWFEYIKNHEKEEKKKNPTTWKLNSWDSWSHLSSKEGRIYTDNQQVNLIRWFDIWTILVSVPNLLKNQDFLTTTPVQVLLGPLFSMYSFWNSTFSIQTKLYKLLNYCKEFRILIGFMVHHINGIEYYSYIWIKH